MTTLTTRDGPSDRMGGPVEKAGAKAREVARIAVSRTGGYLAVARRDGGVRVAPTRGGLARRRWLINTTKFLLPAVSLLLLASIALWPELDRATDRARVAMHDLSAAVSGARLTNAHYGGVDERGRPYTVTATTAVQRTEQLIDMTTPNADVTLENGTWLNVKSKLGVYARDANQLDLSEDVVLYRDDGTTMTTAIATVDMNAGSASSPAQTHVEGPFGTLDATGFTTVDKGTAIQFWGPVQVNLNGASGPGPSLASVATAPGSSNAASPAPAAAALPDAHPAEIAPAGIAPAGAGATGAAK